MEEHAMLRGISCVTSEKQLGPRRLPVDVPEMSLASSGYVVHRELGRGGQGAQSFRAVDFFFCNRIRNSWMWQSCTHFF